MAEEEYEALRAAHARKSAAARGMQGEEDWAHGCNLCVPSCVLCIQLHQ
jgi:hypothetical protein